MTCILALKHEGNIYMAGDRAACSGDIVEIEAMPKLFRLGPALVGFSGDFVIKQTLLSDFEWPIESRPTDIYEFLTLELVPSMKDCLEDAEVDLDHSELLVAVYGQLVYITGSFQVNVIRGDIACTGGVIHGGCVLAATSGHPVERLRSALRAIHRFTPSTVHPPFDVMALDKRGDNVYNYPEPEGES